MAKRKRDCTRPFGHQRKVLIRKLVKRHGGFCYHCLIPLSQKTMTLDHVIPRSYGGTWNHRNLVPACQPCNRQRNNYDFELFRLWKQYQLTKAIESLLPT